MLNFLFLLACPTPVLSQETETADIVFKNGAVYTVDAAKTWAQSLAIKKQKIIYVGTNSGVQRFISNNTKIINLQGKMVLPGFIDSHVHLITGGMTLSECNLSGINKIKNLLEKIRQCKNKFPEKEWITGSGWELTLFERANPSKQLLDNVVADKPVYLESGDGHSAWVNSKALVIAGIGKETEAPSGGRIERDDKTGMPSGVLRESAMRLVAAKIPPPSREDYRLGLRQALTLAGRFGITAVHEANASEQLLKTYLEFDQENKLSVRVTAAIRFDRTLGDKQIPNLISLREKYQGARLKADAVKLFIDGVIESHTAALLLPYVDRPDYSGNPNFQPEALGSLIMRLEAENFQIHVHAIGDRAIRMSLDGFEAAQKINGKRDLRHHIAHLELIDPDDIQRFAHLGVIANFQPLWAYADSYITDLTIPVLGEKRARWLYPMGSVAKTGAVIVGGSDWSVTSMNPLEAMQTAITRSDPEKKKPSSWIPEERVDLPTMIAAYTINGAYLNHREKETGSLEVGKKADLIVLDKNLFAVPVNEIRKAKVLLTLIDGKPSYGQSAFQLK